MFRILVANGARSFATRNGLETIAPERMISSRAMSDWHKWVERYNDSKKAEVPEPETITADALQDTVGAVAWDSYGNVAAGVSRSHLGYSKYWP